MELEILILSKSERERQIPYDINLKYDTNEPICERETESQTQITDLWFPRGRPSAGGWTGRLQIITYRMNKQGPAV